MADVEHRVFELSPETHEYVTRLKEVIASRVQTSVPKIEMESDDDSVDRE